MNSAVEAPAKRYRYTGMERDEESGLNYHTARYYAPWLGRWANADPGGRRGGLNLYLYGSANPCVARDRGGMQDDKVTESAAYYARMADWFYKQGWMDEAKEYREKYHAATFAEAMAQKKTVTEAGDRIIIAATVVTAAGVAALVALPVVAEAAAESQLSFAISSFLKPRVLALALRFSQMEILAPSGYVASSTLSAGAAGVGTGTALATTMTTTAAVSSTATVTAVTATVGTAATATAIAASATLVPNPDPLGLNQQPTAQLLPQQQNEGVLQNARTRASRGYTQEDLSALVQRFLDLLPEAERTRLMRNETVAIGLVQENGYQYILYTVAQNRTSPAIRAAAEQLGFVRATATPRTEGRGDVGAPMDAEQLLLEIVDENDLELLGRPVATRPYCADCACAVQSCH